MKAIAILFLSFFTQISVAEVFEFNGQKYSCSSIEGSSNASTSFHRRPYRCVQRCAVYASNDANSCFQSAADFCGYGARCTKGPCETYASNDPNYCVSRGADICTSDEE